MYLISTAECLKDSFSAMLFKILNNANISIILGPQIFVYPLKIKYLRSKIMVYFYNFYYT